MVKKGGTESQDETIMQSYIVRIYRFERDRPDNLVGVVEESGVEDKKAFTDYDELWRILNSEREEVKTREEINDHGVD